MKINEMLIAGFGGAGYNTIMLLKENLSQGFEYVIIGDNDADFSEAGKFPVLKYGDFDSFSGMLAPDSLCFMLGGQGGESCEPMAEYCRKLHATGIITICLVTYPFKFEGRKEKADSDLVQLEKEANAVLVFYNDKIMKMGGAFGQGLEEIARNMAECITALASPADINQVVRIDKEDLRGILHGAMLHATATQDTLAAAMASALDKLDENDRADMQDVLLYIALPEKSANDAGAWEKISDLSSGDDPLAGSGIFSSAKVFPEMAIVANADKVTVTIIASTNNDS